MSNQRLLRTSFVIVLILAGCTHSGLVIDSRVRSYSGTEQYYTDQGIGGSGSQATMLFTLARDSSWARMEVISTIGNRDTFRFRRSIEKKWQPEPVHKFGVDSLGWWCWRCEIRDDSLNIELGDGLTGAIFRGKRE